jgi:hypothetical protein
MALPYKRNEVKERVRATWKGACNVTLPSFTLQAWLISCAVARTT